MPLGKSLRGKIAVITGVGSGIGKATALRFADSGAKVLGVDLDPLAGKQVIAAMCADGLEASFFEADVSNEKQVKHMIDSALDTYGRIDILHNNAGIMPVHPSIEETPFEVWRQVIAVDLDSVFLGCKYAVPAMKETGGGHIINTASMAGIRGFMWGAHYGAAKGGVITLTLGLADLVEGDGIRVNALCPTGVATNLAKNIDPSMQPIMAAKSLHNRPDFGKSLQPDDIATAAHYLATEADFSGGALIIMPDKNSLPEYFISFGYDWRPLEGISARR